MPARVESTCCGDVGRGRRELGEELFGPCRIMSLLPAGWVGDSRKMPSTAHAAELATPDETPKMLYAKIVRTASK
jgi:hypothetical protein